MVQKSILLANFVIGFRLEYPHLHENSTVADRLYREIRLTCFVMTNKNGIDKYAKFSHRAWGHRCNQVLYISSEKGECRNTKRKLV